MVATLPLRQSSPSEKKTLMQRRKLEILLIRDDYTKGTLDSLFRFDSITNMINKENNNNLVGIRKN